MPPKLGSYGRAAFLGPERFASARSLQRSPSPNADAPAPSESGGASSRGVKIHSGERFRNPKAAALPGTPDTFTPRSFVDEIRARPLGRHAFGTGKRFASGSDRAARQPKDGSAEPVEYYVPPSFADEAVRRASVSRQRTARGRSPVTGDRFKDPKSLTANADFYIPPSSVAQSRLKKGPISPFGERIARSPTPAAAPAAAGTPQRAHSGSPQQSRASPDITADCVAATPRPAPCPAAARFRDSTPRFRELRRSTADVDYVSPPSFVDLILSK